jgi:hypothetical protein
LLKSSGVKAIAGYCVSLKAKPEYVDNKRS